MSFKIKSLVSNIIFFVLLIYAIVDISSSRNLGLGLQNRSSVHLVLLVVIFVLLVFDFLYFLRDGISFDFVVISLIFIALWINLVNLINNMDLWTAVVHLGLSILWILSYQYSRIIVLKKLVNEYNYLNKMLLFLIVYFFSFFIAMYNISSIYGYIPVNNIVYYLLVFFPWVSFIKKRNIKIIFNIMIFLTVILSFKRGAYFIYIFMYIIYILLKSKIEDKKISGLIRIMLLTVLFAIFFLLFNYITNGVLLSRFSLDQLADGSGRSSIYSFALNNIVNRNLLTLLVGLGSGSSIKYFGTGIHNEWLEFGFSFGLLGILLYVVFLSTLIYKLKILVVNKDELAAGYGSMVIFVLLIGLFDGFYFVHNTIYVMMFFGYVEGISQRKLIEYKL